MKASREGSLGRRLWPLLSIVALFSGAAALLRLEGRLWICSCGKVFDLGGPGLQLRSQHLFDPYSFTHVLHGFLFFWLIAWLVPRLHASRQLILAVAVEAAWEVLKTQTSLSNVTAQRPQHSVITGTPSSIPWAT